MKFTWILLLATLIAFSSFATTKTLIIKGDAKKSKNSIKDIDVVLLQDDLSIGAQAPKNWILDRNAAKNFGLCAMYVIKGFSLNNSPAIIYPRISGQKCTNDNVLEEIIQEQAQKYKNESPKFTLEKMPSYKNKKGLIFQVRKYFNGPSPNNFELVGYLRFKNELFLAVYSSKDLKSFNQHITAFNDFLDRVSPYDTDMSALSGNCLYPKE